MNLFKSQKGNFMLFSLIITFVLLFLGTSLLFALNSETRMTLQAELQAQAHYLAQAGIEHGLNLVESVPSGQEPVFPASSVKVMVLGDKVLEYQIVKNGAEVESIGRIKENGDTVKEVRIKAAWDATGNVTIIK